MWHRWLQLSVNMNILSTENPRGLCNVSRWSQKNVIQDHMARSTSMPDVANVDTKLDLMSTEITMSHTDQERPYWDGRIKMGRPRKPENAKVLRTHISYRPDQTEKVRLLVAQKRLSPICQDAIDAAKL